MAQTKSKAKDARDEVKNRAEDTERLVRDYTEDSAYIAKELTRQISESYLTSFKLGLSLWENNLKMMTEYFGQWLSVQQDVYSSLLQMVNVRSADSFLNKDLIEKAFSVQKDYINQIRNLSERGIQAIDREVRENT
ncbi:MAG TPA: hypothetical protein VLB01_05870 [Thermodesulfobacteriota bacterium]|nr:hypothetical protein [Thermodesulfobacteriota bacterium]